MLFECSPPHINEVIFKLEKLTAENVFVKARFLNPQTFLLLNGEEKAINSWRVFSHISLSSFTKLTPSPSSFSVFILKQR